MIEQCIVCCFGFFVGVWGVEEGGGTKSFPFYARTLLSGQFSLLGQHSWTRQVRKWQPTFNNILCPIALLYLVCV